MFESHGSFLRAYFLYCENPKQRTILYDTKSQKYQMIREEELSALDLQYRVVTNIDESAKRIFGEIPKQFIQRSISEYEVETGRSVERAILPKNFTDRVRDGDAFRSDIWDSILSGMLRNREPIKDLLGTNYPAEKFEHALKTRQPFEDMAKSVKFPPKIMLILRRNMLERGKLFLLDYEEIARKDPQSFVGHMYTKLMTRVIGIGDWRLPKKFSHKQISRVCGYIDRHLEQPGFDSLYDIHWHLSMMMQDAYTYRYLYSDTFLKLAKSFDQKLWEIVNETAREGVQVLRIRFRKVKEELVQGMEKFHEWISLAHDEGFYEDIHSFFFSEDEIAHLLCQNGSYVVPAEVFRRLRAFQNITRRILYVTKCFQKWEEIKEMKRQHSLNLDVSIQNYVRIDLLDPLFDKEATLEDKMNYQPFGGRFFQQSIEQWYQKNEES